MWRKGHQQKKDHNQWQIKQLQRQDAGKDSPAVADKESPAVADNEQIPTLLTTKMIEQIPTLLTSRSRQRVNIEPEVGIDGFSSMRPKIMN